jgi:hypothetical protein
MPLPAEKDPFVELDRTFARQKDASNAESEADSSYLFEAFLRSHGNVLDWAGLLKKHRVVILGEAGSGKTWEMQEQVKKLEAAGTTAFFIRLDELAGANCRVVMTDEPYKRLQQGLASGDEVSLFLDSVDEAKLVSPAAFRLALKNLRDALSSSVLPRVKLFLSTRISAWNSDAELPGLRELFGRGPARKKATTEDLDEKEDAKSESSQADWEVFNISPLNREQVAKLSRESGISDSDAFLGAIDSAHAWEFARRPSDVKPLAKFWLKNSRLGTLTELIEFDVAQKLREQRSHADNLLTEEEARIGAEALAAGCVLCQMPVIRLPTSDGADDALDGKACLPAEGWVGGKYTALLDRPIFDEANLGKVRFHHRRVREFLAAKWIERQMHAGCPLHEFEDIFFDQVGGVRVMRGSLSPIAVWLCAGNESWNNFMRQWIIETQPEIVLRFGDPQALRAQFRRELLQDLVVRAKSAQHLWLSADDGTLSRFGDEEIAADLAQVAADQSLADDLRSAALEIIKLATLVSCRAAILSIFTSAQEDKRIRGYAALTLVEIGDDSAFAEMAQHLVQMPVVNLHLVGLATERLWPRFLSIDQLVALLVRVEREHDLSTELKWQLAKPLEGKLTIDMARDLATRLAKLVQEEPCLTFDFDTPPISQRNGWLRPLLRVVAAKMMEGANLSEIDAQLVATCITLLGGTETGEESPDPLGESSKRHPYVRRAYLWSQVALRRLNQQRILEGWWNLSFGSSYRISPVAEDIAWLLEDASRKPTADDKILALRLAWEIAVKNGASRRVRSAFRKVSDHDAALRDIYRNLVADTQWHPIKRLQWRAKDTILHGFWWKRTWHDFKAFKLRQRDRFFLLKNRGKLSRGELVHVLATLVGDAERKNSDRWAPSNWSGVDKKWGIKTRDAVRTGCKRFWRTYSPKLPHEKQPKNTTPHEVIVGLSGIHAQWQDGEFDFKALTVVEVQQLTRYAADELNGFPDWFQALADSRPEIVGAVLAEAISGEWSDTSTSHGEPDVIRKLVHVDCEKLLAVRDAIAEQFTQSEPGTSSTLTLAISVMLNCGDQAQALVAAEAAKRAVDPGQAMANRARWLATLIRLQGALAKPVFEKVSLEHPDADDVIVGVCANLSGRLEQQPTTKSRPFLTASALEWFIPIAYRHIRPKDDLHHTGGYTPNARDEAQRMRDGLVNMLGQQSDSAVPGILADLAGKPELVPHADWLRHLRLESLQRLADQNPWHELHVRQFAAEKSRSPRTAADLFRITLNRLLDIKKQLEESNTSLRETLASDVNEAALRRWLADQLTQASRNQYTAPQESVIADEQRPDIRIQHPEAGSVSIEIKWATDWSFNELKHALEDQLVTRYLKAHNSNHGILILGRHEQRENANKSWDSPDGLVNLGGLVQWLERRAKEIEAANMQVKRVSVISIDFRPKK